jgi:uncharacterized protein YjiS (DUF1127 family)
MFTTIRDRFNRWQRYSRTTRELSNLTNRDLADLGLTRFDIERVARESAR